MDQNKENIIPEIKIPELPNEEAPKKKKSKLPLVIILSAVCLLIIAAAIPAGILLAPIMQITHWENTINEVFFDQNELSVFSEALSEGMRTDISVDLEKELTGLLKDVSLDISIASRLADEKASGSMTFILNGGAKSLALTLIYDETDVALGIYELSGGLAKGDVEYLSFPREGLSEAFKSSLFAPDSGAKYALDADTFDQIVSMLESFESADKTQDIEGLEASLQNVANQILDIAEPYSIIYFADGAFALCNKRGVTLDDDEMRAIIDVIADEAEANEAFAALISSSYSMTSEDSDIVSALRDAGDEIPDCETSFFYVIQGDYVTGLSLSYTDLEDSNNSFDADLDFVYGGTEKGFDLLITYENEDADTVSYRKEATDSENSVSLNIKSEGEEFNTKVTHFVADNSLIITANASDSPESSFELKGSCIYNADDSSISLSISSIKIGSADPIEGFGVEFSLGKYTEDITLPESKPIFNMSESELDGYLERLPSDTFGDMVKSCTGKELESFFSADGILMLNPEQYTEIATAYANAYSIYLGKTEIMRADAVYIPVPELGINILLYYDKWGNMIYYNFAYNMIDELLASYHIASIDEKGEMVVHDIVTSSTAATCMNTGKTVYRCTICGESDTETTRALGHSTEWLSVEALCDDGKVYNVRYSKCRTCGLVESFGIGDGISISYNLTINTATGVHTIFNTSSTSREGICRYFGLPTVLEETITVGDFRENLDVSGKYVIRLPKGLETLSGNRLSYSDEMQILIIPSTLKSISSTAFSSYKNLHTVFYCGTEEEWKQVSFDKLENLGDKVKIIFSPNGVTPDLIADALVDPEKMEKSVSTAKKSFTSSINAAKKLTALDSISLVHSSKIKGVAYCKNTNSVAVYSEYDGKNTSVTVYDLGTMIKTASLNVSGEINALDMADGYIAYGLADSAKTLYLYSVADNTTKELAVPLNYEHSRDQLAFVLIDSGKVYTVSSEQHCYFVYYSIAEDKFVTINQIYEAWIEIDREAHLVTVKTHTTPQSIYYYDTENGVLLDSPGSAYPGSFVTVDTEYRTVEQLSILLGRQGSAKLVVSSDYKTMVAIKNASSDTVRYVECYAESAIVTSNGNFLLYTPGGYGLLLIDTN